MLCPSRVASVLRAGGAPGGGVSAGGRLLLWIFEVQRLCGTAQQPAGGAVFVDWL